MAERDLQARINEQRSRRQLLRNTAGAGLLALTGVGVGIGIDRLVLIKEKERELLRQLDLDYPDNEAEFVKTFDKVSDELKKTIAPRPIPPTPIDGFENGHEIRFELEYSGDIIVKKEVFSLIRGDWKNPRGVYRDFQLQAYHVPSDEHPQGRVDTYNIIFINNIQQNFGDLKMLGQNLIVGYNKYAKNFNFGLKNTN